MRPAGNVIILYACMVIKYVMLFFIVVIPFIKSGFYCWLTPLSVFRTSEFRSPIP